METREAYLARNLRLPAVLRVLTNDERWGRPVGAASVRAGAPDGTATVHVRAGGMTASAVIIEGPRVELAAWLESKASEERERIDTPLLPVMTAEDHARAARWWESRSAALRNLH